jgi:exonuclease III
MRCSDPKREGFARLLAQGWTDALRKQHPDERIYTFCDYFRNHYSRDRGLRIDHCSSVPRSRRGLQWFSLRFC